MIDHLGINCRELSRAAEFYDRVLGALGYRCITVEDTAISYGLDEPDFWIQTFDEVGVNREVHVAFRAPDAASVRAWYTEALEAGAEPLHAPRLWPRYHADYFAAFVRDTEGNSIEAVCHHGDC